MNKYDKFKNEELTRFHDLSVSRYPPYLAATNLAAVLFEHVSNKMTIGWLIIEN